MSLWSRLKEIGRNVAVQPRVKETPKPLHVEPTRKETPPIVNARAKALDELVAMTADEYDDRFPACLKIILKHEGGYINHPKDPGGRTNLGVTQRVWEAWVGRKVTEQEMRALTPEMVAPLYRKNYWDKVRASELPAGLDLHVFDFAVNAGPARAIRYLQMMCGAQPDGKIGPATMRSLGNYLEQYGTEKAVVRYGELREQYYRQLKTFATFGRGWMRRVAEVTTDAKGMAA